MFLYMILGSFMARATVVLSLDYFSCAKVFQVYYSIYHVISMYWAMMTRVYCFLRPYDHLITSFPYSVKHLRLKCELVCVFHKPQLWLLFQPIPFTALCEHKCHIVIKVLTWIEVIQLTKTWMKHIYIYICIDTYGEGARCQMLNV